MASILIGVTISMEAAKRILDIIDDYDDEGPTHEGWQSIELIDTIEELREAIEEAEEEIIP